MTSKGLVGAALAAILLATTPALAQDISVSDGYLRSSTPSSTTGAAFFTLTNGTMSDDRLLSAQSDMAERVELHTHSEGANGVMRMGEIEGGMALPAGQMHVFARGGDHLMFIGLKGPLEEGTQVPVTLTFERAGAVRVTLPVDRARRPDHGGMKH